MDRTESIRLMNAAVADELKAVHQYMYWHFHLDDQGFAPLAALLRRIAIMEMGHIERFAERILFLKGEVEMTANAAVERITEPQAILARACEMEQEAIVMYNQSAIACARHADSASKQLFESVILDEESHFDQFDKQVDNIRRFGPNYLALQSFGTAGPETAPDAGGAA